jgi:hypothetical protein
MQQRKEKRSSYDLARHQKAFISDGTHKAEAIIRKVRVDSCMLPKEPSCKEKNKENRPASEHGKNRKKILKQITKLNSMLNKFAHVEQ